MSNGLSVREMSTEIVGPDGEVFDFRGAPSALEAVTRAEIDIQISTAKRFPRSVDRFLKEAITMVSISPELAEKCTYALPGRRSEGNGQGGPISGPSVRLAEIAACCWGNLRIVGRITDDDGKSVTAQGVCVDLERNVGYSVEVRRGVTKRNGDRFSADMVNVACNAAIAIATRNATFKAIPRAFVNVVHERAQEIARGDVATLSQRVDKALGYFESQGVTEQEVFKAIGVVGYADINLDHLATLTGFRSSIVEGVATIDELFRADKIAAATSAPVAPGESKTSALKDRLVADKPKPAPPETPPPVQETAPAAPPWSPPAPETPAAAPAAHAPESAPAPAPKSKSTGPKPYFLDGLPATADELAARAREYGWTGKSTSDAIYILRENGHKISQADKGGAS